LHRDLKSLNIFLKQGNDIRVGDLGVAKVLKNTFFAKTFIGTPYYLSPEICEDKPYSFKSDVWALGCILYELCTLHHPFEAKSQGALVLKILNGNPTPIKKSYSEDLQKVITLILEKNIYKRPSCKTILKLPYIIEKVKKLNMIQQYQIIGLKIPNKSNPFRKIIIKRAKIDLSEDSNIKKNNNIKTNKIKLDISNTSNDNSNINNINSKQNKNKSHFLKKDNPWSTEYNRFRKDIKNSHNNKIPKKPINVIKILNDNILKNKSSSKKKAKRISPSKLSPTKSPKKI
jgi:NIMA (never in mitosis gene a)-related kinase